MTVRAKETPYLLNGTILFMNANWTVRTTTLVDLGAAKAPGDTGYFPHEAIFLPDFDTDNDETLAI